MGHLNSKWKHFLGIFPICVTCTNYTVRTFVTRWHGYIFYTHNDCKSRLRSDHIFIYANVCLSSYTLRYLKELAMAIVTEGQLGKDTDTLKRSLTTCNIDHRQHKQLVAWTGDILSTSTLKPHEGPTWKANGEGGKTGTLLKQSLNRPWHASALERFA